MEKAKGQYVYLGDYCGRVEHVDGGTLYIRFDDHTLPGKVREAHEHFHPLHEQQAQVPAERIWADGASVCITAYQYDLERQVIRIRAERTTQPAGARAR